MRSYDLSVPVFQEVICQNSTVLEHENYVSEKIDFVHIDRLNKKGYILLHEIEILDNDKILEYIDIQNIKAGDIIYIDDIQLKCTVIFDGYISLTPLDQYLYKPQYVNHDDYLPER